MRALLGKKLDGWEWGAGIYQFKNREGKLVYGLTPITPGFKWSNGQQLWVDDKAASREQNPFYYKILDGKIPNASMAAFIHSHPLDGNEFSHGDLQYAYIHKMDAYVLTPDAGLRTSPGIWRSTQAERVGEQVPGIPVKW